VPLGNHFAASVDLKYARSLRGVGNIYYIYTMYTVQFYKSDSVTTPFTTTTMTIVELQYVLLRKYLSAISVSAKVCVF